MDDYCSIQKKMIRTELLRHNKNLKEGTSICYANNIKSLLMGWCEIDTNDFVIQWIPYLMKNPEKLIEIINNRDCSVNTKKNYYSALCSVVRGLAVENEDFIAYYSYQKEHDNLSEIITKDKIEQAPNNKEMHIMGMTMDDVKKALWIHKQMSKEGDKQSLKYYMIGLFHCELVLRNELASVIWTKEYKELEDGWEYKNFIYGTKNKKYLVIRNNKVRHFDNPNFKERVIPLENKGGDRGTKRELNWVLKKWINTHEYIKDGDYLLGKELSSSSYTQLLGRVFAHKKWNLSSSLIRKIYAIDIRERYKGKLKEEMEACQKLDHTIGVHNTDYVLYFD